MAVAVPGDGNACSCLCLRRFRGPPGAYGFFLLREVLAWRLAGHLPGGKGNMKDALK